MEQLALDVDEARACNAGQTCTLAGGGQGTCDGPLNQAEAARIEAPAGRVACWGAMVECPSPSESGCEAGICGVDQPV
jgi:hypothetical protein